jgi:ATP-binding cassette subfamily B protein RaxB
LDAGLILDKATSHLDVWNERAVNDAIKSIPLTRIIVAHHPETIAITERFIVFEQGNIARNGIQENPTLSTS